MKVLLTGASGFLGRYVLRQLEERRVETVVIGRSCPQEHAGEFIETDLLEAKDYAPLRRKAQGACLLHLAWYAEHGRYWSSPLNLQWVEATIRLVEAFCTGGGQKVVAAGTCAEYDWRCGYCREDTSPLNPTSMYGTAKDATRRLVSALCKLHEIPFAWGRIFVPYGQGEDSRRLIPGLIDVFRGQRVPFGVNANSYRDFIHADDVARGFLQLLLSDAEGSYNICSGKPTRIAEVVEIIANAFNGDPRLVLDMATARPGEPEILIGDNRKLKALGWQALHSITDIAAGCEA